MPLLLSHSPAENIETKVTKIDSLGRRWNSALHPRDAKGRFIETGGIARVWMGGLGMVQRALLGGKVEMKMQDGSTRVVPGNRITMIRRPNGEKPTANALKVAEEDERRTQSPNRADGVRQRDAGDPDGPSVPDEDPEDEDDDNPYDGEDDEQDAYQASRDDARENDLVAMVTENDDGEPQYVLASVAGVDKDGKVTHVRLPGDSTRHRRDKFNADRDNDTIIPREDVDDPAALLEDSQDSPGNPSIFDAEEVTDLVDGYAKPERKKRARPDADPDAPDHGDFTMGKKPGTITRGTPDGPVVGTVKKGSDGKWQVTDSDGAAVGKAASWDNGVGMLKRHLDRRARNERAAKKVTAPKKAAAAKKPTKAQQEAEAHVAGIDNPHRLDELARSPKVKPSIRAAAQRKLDEGGLEPFKAGDRVDTPHGPGRVAVTSDTHATVDMDEGKGRRVRLTDLTRETTDGSPETPVAPEPEAPAKPAGVRLSRVETNVGASMKSPSGNLIAHTSGRNNWHAYRKVDGTPTREQLSSGNIIGELGPADENGKQSAVAYYERAGKIDGGLPEFRESWVGSENDRAPEPTRPPSDREQVYADTSTPEGAPADEQAPLRQDRPAVLGDVPAEPVRDGGEPGDVLPAPGRAGGGTGAGVSGPDAPEAPEGPPGEPDDRAADRVSAAGREGVRGSGDERPDLPAPGAGDRGSAAGRERPARVGGRRARGVAAQAPATQNFRPESQADLARATPEEKLADNLAALRLLRRLQAEDRQASPDEQRVLARWAGWGALSKLFNEDDPDWAAQRDELKGLLSEKEWRDARHNMLNAHYTDAALVDEVWKAIRDLGFGGGDVLEPGSGSGNFIGRAPDGARMTGVELDPITAAVSKQLYPEAEIHHESFAKSPFNDGVFDAAVGNVPFGNYGHLDRKHNPNGHSIHNHFIIKALAGLKPGGVASFITSQFTLDNMSPAARREMYEHADLIGAVRLPGGAHERAANTGVVTDVLVFRKRKPGEAKGDDSWLTSSPAVHPDGSPVTGVAGKDKAVKQLNINDYFKEHPDRVLGTIVDGGYNGMKIEGDGDHVAELRETLADLTDQAKAAGRGHNPDPDDPNMTRAKRNSGETAEGRITYVGDETTTDEDGNTVTVPRFKQVDDGELVDFEPYAPGNASKAAKQDAPYELRDLIEIRDQFAKLRDLEEDPTLPDDDAELINARKRLNDLYDAYVAKRGPITRYTETLRGLDDDGNPLPPIQRFPGLGGFKRDESSAMVFGLEHSFMPPDPDDKKGKGAAKKADIFEARQFDAERRVADHTDDPRDAVSIASERGGRFTLDEVARVLNVSPEDARVAIRPYSFEDPERPGSYVDKQDYLSGHVRNKLRAAQAAAAEDPRWNENVKALEEVKPADATLGEIPLQLGQPWIPEAMLTEFARTLMKQNDRWNASKGVTVSRGADGVWSVKRPRAGRNSDRNQVLEEQTWGIEAKFNFYDLFQKMLRQQHHEIKVMRENEDGSKWEDVKASKAAKAKVKEIEAAWIDFIWSDAGRADTLTRDYSERFRAIVPRASYDDAPMRAMPGMAKGKTLRPHQNGAVTRAVSEETVLLDHVVGSGKTYTLAGIAMELRRLGMARKPVLAVPNHMLGQWTSEFRELYPNAKILAADSESLDKANRKQFAARAAMSDWDVVVMTYTAFESIPVSVEGTERYLRKEIDRLEAAKRKAIAKAREEGKAPDKNEEKRIETAIANAIRKLEAQITARKDEDDNGINFEALGFDYVMVDEAHNFKNLDFTTSMQGVSSPDGANRARDMHMKIDVLRDNSPTDGTARIAAFATGTPVSNSLAEMYTMTRFLRPGLLEEVDLADFDSWAATFAKAESKREADAAAGGYVSRTRLRGFTDALGDGLRIWRSFADTKTAEMLNLPRPKIKGGERIIHKIDMSEAQAQAKDSFRHRLIHVPRGRKKEKGEDNHLAIINDGRQAAVDPRLMSQRGLDASGIDPDEDMDSPKLERAAQQIFELWEANKDRQYKVKHDDPDDVPLAERPGALQMVMMDVGTPKKKGGFSGYQHLKDLLVEKGMPASEIRFIQETAGSSAKKAKLFEQARQGEVSVLFGSSAALGTGTNVQNRLLALHHIDGSWKPSDIEQREGRILRQGNQNGEIELHAYVTKGTHDIVTWDMTAYKQKVLNAIANGDLDQRAAEFADDVDPLNDYDVLAGAAEEDPLAREARDLEPLVEDLRIAETNHKRRVGLAQSTALKGREAAKLLERKIEQLKTALGVRSDDRALTLEAQRSYSPPEQFTDRKAAAAALAKKLDGMWKDLYWGDANIRRPQGIIGKLGGFNVVVMQVKDAWNGERFELRLTDQRYAYSEDEFLPLETIIVKKGDLKDATPLITKLENRVSGIENRITRLEQDREARLAEVGDAEVQASKPFAQAEELEEAERSKALLDAILTETALDDPDAPPPTRADEPTKKLTATQMRDEYERLKRRSEERAEAEAQRRAAALAAAKAAQSVEKDVPPAASDEERDATARTEAREVQLAVDEVNEAREGLGIDPLETAAPASRKPSAAAPVPSEDDEDDLYGDLFTGESLGTAPEPEPTPEPTRAPETASPAPERDATADELEEEGESDLAATPVSELMDGDVFVGDDDNEHTIESVEEDEDSGEVTLVTTDGERFTYSPDDEVQTPAVGEVSVAPDDLPSVDEPLADETGAEGPQPERETAPEAPDADPVTVKGTPEYRAAYDRGWRATPGALERADDRGEPGAWYDGYQDNAAGRPKWTLMHHDSAEAYDASLADEDEATETEAAAPEPERNPDFGKRIGAVNERPGPAESVTLTETLGGRRPGQTVDRVLWRVEKRDGVWGAYPPQEQAPASFSAGTKREALSWARDRANGIPGPDEVAAEAPEGEPEATPEAVAAAGEVTIPGDAVFDRFPESGEAITLADGRNVTFDADELTGITAFDEDGNRIDLTTDELMGWRPYREPEPEPEATLDLDVPEGEAPTRAPRPAGERAPRSARGDEGVGADGTREAPLDLSDVESTPDAPTIGDAIAEVEAEAAAPQADEPAGDLTALARGDLYAQLTDVDVPDARKEAIRDELARREQQERIDAAEAEADEAERQYAESLAADEAAAGAGGDEPTTTPDAPGTSDEPDPERDEQAAREDFEATRNDAYQQALAEGGTVADAEQAADTAEANMVGSGDEATGDRALPPAAAEPLTPRQLDGENYPLNPQQQTIADRVVGMLKNVLVRAKAGTGKTSTLEAIARRFAESEPDKRVLYVAFNKTVQVEAEGRMPGNTESRTGHSLAYQWIGKEWTGNKVSFPGRPAKNTMLRTDEDVARHLGISSDMPTKDQGTTLTPRRQAKIVMTAVGRYSSSADDDLAYEHFKDQDGNDLLSNLPDAQRAKMLTYANKAWADINDKTGTIPVQPDHYRKIWALSRPDLTKDGRNGAWKGAGVIFLDEAQDTPPALAKVIADQKTQKVIVGDGDQQIYTFTGAINYLDRVEGVDADDDLPLTTSYRFGRTIADIGNRFLQRLGSKDRVVGGGATDGELVENMGDADAILTRTNGGMIRQILSEQMNDRLVGVTEGTKRDLMLFLDSAAWLRGESNRAPSSMHEDLAPFDTWAQVEEAIEEDGDRKLTMLKNLLEQNGGTEGLRAILNRVVELDDNDPNGERIGEERGDGPVADSGPLSKVNMTDDGTRLVLSGGTAAITRMLREDTGGGLRQFGFSYDGDTKTWTHAGTPEQRTGALDRLRGHFRVGSPTGEAARKPDVVVVTAHKSKGLEWDRVKIADDFYEPEYNDETDEWKYPEDEELRLNYVAVTRAGKALDAGSLRWIFAHSDENGREPREAEEPAGEVTVAPEDLPTVDTTPETRPGLMDDDYGPEDAQEALEAQARADAMAAPEPEAVPETAERDRLATEQDAALEAFTSRKDWLNENDVEWQTNGQGLPFGEYDGHHVEVTKGTIGPNKKVTVVTTDRDGRERARDEMIPNGATSKAEADRLVKRFMALKLQGLRSEDLASRLGDAQDAAEAAGLPRYIDGSSLTRGDRVLDNDENEVRLGAAWYDRETGGATFQGWDDAGNIVTWTNPHGMAKRVSENPDEGERRAWDAPRPDGTEREWEQAQRERQEAFERRQRGEAAEPAEPTPEEEGEAANEAAAAWAEREAQREATEGLVDTGLEPDVDREDLDLDLDETDLDPDDPEIADTPGLESRERERRAAERARRRREQRRRRDKNEPKPDPDPNIDQGDLPADAVPVGADIPDLPMFGDPDAGGAGAGAGGADPADVARSIRDRLPKDRTYPRFKGRPDPKRRILDASRAVEDGDEDGILELGRALSSAATTAEDALGWNAIHGEREKAPRDLRLIRELGALSDEAFAAAGRESIRGGGYQPTHGNLPREDRLARLRAIQDQAREAGISQGMGLNQVSDLAAVQRQMRGVEGGDDVLDYFIDKAEHYVAQRMERRGDLHDPTAEPEVAPSVRDEARNLAAAVAQQLAGKEGDPAYEHAVPSVAEVLRAAEAGEWREAEDAAAQALYDAENDGVTEEDLGFLRRLEQAVNGAGRENYEATRPKQATVEDGRDDQLAAANVGTARGAKFTRAPRTTSHLMGGVSGRRTDDGRMIAEGLKSAVESDATRYLVPTRDGWAVDDRPLTTADYYRIEPDGSVFHHPYVGTQEQADERPIRRLPDEEVRRLLSQHVAGHTPSDRGDEAVDTGQPALDEPDVDTIVPAAETPDEADTEDTRPAPLVNGVLPLEDLDLPADTGTGDYTPEQIDHLANYPTGSLAVEHDGDWHMGQFVPGGEGDTYSFLPLGADEPVPFTRDKLGLIRAVRSGEIPGDGTDPRDLRPGTLVSGQNVATRRRVAGVLAGVTDDGRAIIRDANGDDHTTKRGGLVRPIMGAYAPGAEPTEEAFAPVPGVWTASRDGRVAAGVPGEWVAGIRPNDDGTYDWQVQGVPGSGLGSDQGRADSLEEAKAQIEDTLAAWGWDNTTGAVTTLPGEDPEDRDSKSRTILPPAEDETEEAPPGDEATEDAAGAAPDVAGQPAGWVPTGDLAPGDIAHVTGDNGNGSAATRSGHVLGTPESVEVHTPGNKPEKGHRTTVGDDRDGLGDRGTVLTPEGAVAARAERDEEEVGAADEPRSVAESQVLAGAVGEAVPTDSQGLGLFPGSKVTDRGGRDGLVVEASARDAAVRWSGDDEDRRVRPGTLTIPEGGQVRPEGWTTGGHVVRPRQIVTTSDGQRGTVESVSGDTAAVALPDGIREVPVEHLAVRGKVADDGTPTAPEPVTVKPRTAGELKKGDTVLLPSASGRVVPGEVLNVEADGDRVRIGFANTRTGETEEFTAAHDYELPTVENAETGEPAKVSVGDGGNFDAPTGPEGLDVRPTDPVKPEPLPEGARASKVALRPEHRTAFVDLGLDTDQTSPLDVQQAAARVRHDMPITADQAAALAGYLEELANSEGVTGRQKRILGRLRNRVTAAGDRATPPAPEPMVPTLVRAGDLAPGDVIALPDNAGGEAEVGTLVTVDPTAMNGQVVEGVMELPDGSRVPVMFSGQSEVYRLPDLPAADQPIAYEALSPVAEDRPFTEPRVAERLDDAAAAVTDGALEGADGIGTLDELAEHVTDRLDEGADAPGQRRAGDRLDTALEQSGVDEDAAALARDVAEDAADGVAAEVADTVRNTVEDAEPLPGESQAEATERVKDLIEEAADAVDTDAAVDRAFDQAEAISNDEDTVPPTGREQEQARQDTRDALRADLFGFADRLAALGDTENANTLALVAARMAGHPDPVHVQAATRALAMGRPPSRIRSLSARVRGMFARARQRFLDAVRRLMGTGRKARRSWKAAVAAARAEWTDDERDLNGVVDDAARHLGAGGDTDPAVTVPGEPAGFTDRVAYWRDQLPDNPVQFGHRQVRARRFREVTLDALRAGRTLGTEDAEAFRLDRAADGGPGQTALGHLDALKGIGSAIDDEVAARVRAALPEYGDDPAGAVAEARRHADELSREQRGDMSDAELGTLRTKAMDEADAMATRYADAVAEATLGALEAIRPMGPQGSARLNIRSRSDDAEEVRALRWAEQHFPTDWLAAAGTVEALAGRQGEYEDGGKITVAPLGQAPRTGAGEYGASALHGLGHHIEAAVPGLRDAQWAYHWTRTASGAPGDRRRRGRNALGSLADVFPALGLSRREVARRGDYDWHWLGKENEGQEAWETLPLTLEAVFAGKEYLDDDLKKFLLGLMGWMGRNA